MLGNFPQAYSHVGLINCALNLSREIGPAGERAEAQEPDVAAAPVSSGRAMNGQKAQSLKPPEFLVPRVTPKKNRSADTV
jgi:hypothetical protein